MLDTTAMREAYDAILEASVTVAGTAHLRTPRRVNGMPIGSWPTSVSSPRAPSPRPRQSQRANTPPTTIATPSTPGPSTVRPNVLAGSPDCVSACAVRPRSSAASADPPCPIPNSIAPSCSSGSPRALLTDAVVPLRGLFEGLADIEIPNHTRQLLALLPEGAAV